MHQCEHHAHALLALQGWVKLQPDLCRQVFAFLDANTCWQLRHVSKHWASVSESAQWPEMSLPAFTDAVHNRIADLQKYRAEGKLRSGNFNFLVSQPMSWELLSTLFLQILEQVGCAHRFRAGLDAVTLFHILYTSKIFLMQGEALTACSVSLACLVPAFDLLHQHSQRYCQLFAKASAFLRNSYQLDIKISIVHPVDDTWWYMPDPDVLLELQHCLHAFDTCSVLTQRLAICSHRAATTVEHLSALAHSNLNICAFFLRRKKPLEALFASSMMH